jgi:hypothetical protein
MTLPKRSGKAPNEHRFFPDSLESRRGISKELPGTFFEHWQGMDMTDQRDADQRSLNPEPTLNRSDRFVFGAVVFATLIGGLLLYSTRQREESTNQGGVISAPATPAVPGGKK